MLTVVPDIKICREKRVTMRKNIVFDIGNVLVDYNIKAFLAKKGFGSDMIKRILKASIMSPYWEAFERCDLSEEEAMRAFVSLDPEIEKEIYEAYENIHGMLTIRPFAISLVKELKEKGYGVYYLSNYSSKAYRECNDSLAFMEYMDGGCLSFQEKMTKPDVRFYNCFLERYHLSAQDCIFVDDTPENVEVAKQLGFQGIVFESYEKTLEMLNLHIPL